MYLEFLRLLPKVVVPDGGLYAGVGGLHQLRQVGDGVQSLQRVHLQSAFLLTGRAENLAVDIHRLHPALLHNTNIYYLTQILGKYHR